MYLDAVHDMNGVLIFNTVEGRIVNILYSMTEEARLLYTVRRGQDLRQYTVQEYLDRWDSQNV